MQFAATSPIILLLAALAGALFASLIAYALATRRHAALAEDWQDRLDDECRDSNRLKSENQKLLASLKGEHDLGEKLKKTAVAQRTELHALRSKEKQMSEALLDLKAERDEQERKIVTIQRSLLTANSRVRELETEFGKSRQFYKGQLMSAFERRRSLEEQVDEARNEQDNLTSLLATIQEENETVSTALSSAETRLVGLDALEQQIVSLEADNAALRQDVQDASARVESAQESMHEAHLLRRENDELAANLEHIEASRRQFEEDARRYKEQFDHSESESETLRMRLGDIQQRLAEMEEQNVEAREQVAQPNPLKDMDQTIGDVDDLTLISGVGRVMESMLHRLGIYYFRQIAAFGPAELARVNAELKQFKGRIEHDDWVGQARELHVRKYGEMIPPMNGAL